MVSTHSLLGELNKGPKWKSRRLEKNRRWPRGLCSHELCRELRRRYPNTKYGVGVAIIINGKVVGFLENGGKKRGKLNICTGAMESCDNCCVFAAMTRELGEEGKIQYTVEEFIDIATIPFEKEYIQEKIPDQLVLAVIHLEELDIDILNDLIQNNTSGKPEENEIAELKLIDYMNEEYTQRTNEKVSYIGRQVFKKLQLIYSTSAVET